MSKSEFENFCNKIDYLEFINSLKEEIQDNLLKLNNGKQKLERFNKKQGKYINKEIKSTAIYIQTQLITKFIIPYFENNSEIINELKEKSPKLLLVAMGAPKQEEFIYEAKNVLPSTLMIGIGGSFDVWAGNVKRAPKIWQKLGLEWLYRTIKQPERFKRIFPTLPIFICSIIEEQYLKKGV